MLSLRYIFFLLIQSSTLKSVLSTVLTALATLLHVYIYISNTNEDKTHCKDYLYFDQLVGLPQGETDKLVEI